MSLFKIHSIDLDLWRAENKPADIAGADCYFSDIDCIYRGNVYDSSGRAIGDYSARNSVDIENCLPVVFNN